MIWTLIDEYNLPYYDVFYTDKYCLEDFDLMWQNLEKRNVIKVWTALLQKDEAQRERGKY